MFLHQRRSIPGLFYVTARLHVALLAPLLLAGPAAAQESLWYGSAAPGTANASVEGPRALISNDILTARWSAESGLQQASFVDRLADAKATAEGDAFVIAFRDGSKVSSSQMKIVDGPRVEDVPGQAEAARWAERLSGKRVLVELRDEKRGMDVRWAAILRDDSNYVREELSVTASGGALDISEVKFSGFTAKAAHVDGTVSGSPIVTEDLFFGLEHPLAKCVVAKTGEGACAMARAIPLQAGQSVSYSAVWGIFAEGQARRSFLNYLERERAHPYRSFLTYNSWFDIGYENPYDEKAALHVIDRYGEELVRKRKVQLDSFLFDDGWDDPKTLWKFNAGFPDGFRKVRERAESFGAAPGVWLSPWGGYDKALQERLKYGRTQGFETNDHGFALSGPRYFERFREVTLEFLRDYGVNQFKIDGTGNVNYVFKGSKFDSDFHAAIELISEWRHVKPDVFVNLTTGTFPSPFWLRYADSIWRGGDDTNFGGVGTWREKWITYRDGQTFANIVRGGPLFPLNSLMLHGMVFAKQAEHLTDDPGHDFTNEIWTYFGSGTDLQEMYITPDALPEEEWEVLATAAKWSRERAEILRDTHWVGGDPAKLQMYGWAAWAPELAILTLRNPAAREQSAEFDLAAAFETPKGATTDWTLTRIDSQAVRIPTEGSKLSVRLRPFEVMVLEAKPASAPQ